MELLTIFIEIIVAIIFSGFFSGMEIAFVSSSKLRFEMDKSEKSITSHILSHFYQKPNEFISTLLVGNNISLVIYGILMAQVITILFGNYLNLRFDNNEGTLVMIQTIISTVIILFTGEFLPKTLFKINPNRMLTLFAVPAFVCYVVLYPISKIATGISKMFLLMSGTKINKKETAKAFTKVDLDYLIQSSIDNTKDDKEINDEVKIFQNALDFSNVKIRDCIVPRTEIQAVEVNSSIDVLRSHFIESGNSKIIIYKEDIDHIIGYIHSSELFRHTDDWNKNLRNIPIVPETMGAQKLMKLFIKNKKSIAVVVDEFGGTSGIVTLEDLVEEIFGDIEDEHDNTTYIAKQTGENDYILSARLEIEKVNEKFNLELPENDEYLTIGGLILHEYQSFPKLHEIITIGRYQFKILKVTNTKIELVRLKIIE